MQLSDFEIGWLVGLIEGDGTFTLDGRMPVIALKITDFDVALRFATLLNTTVHGPYHYDGQQLGEKPYYIAKLVGSRARQFMGSTVQFFGARRQARIRELLGSQMMLKDVPAYEVASGPYQRAPNRLVA